MTRSNSGTPIQVGIADLGRAGWDIHAKAMADLPNRFAIVAVCDPKPERRVQAQERFACRAYAGYAGLVADDEVELLVDATPSHLHARNTILALRAGKHVLVEKPMATAHI